MKAVSFNVNGIRARMHQLQALIEQHQPDIIGLQETKVIDELFPAEDIQAMGYHAVYHGQKGHYGVALLSRQPPVKARQGFPHDGEDSQRRLVYGAFDTPMGLLHLYNGYFPQGENRDHPLKFPAKNLFYRHLLEHLQEFHSPKDNILVMGDMNVAPTDLDIGIGEENRKRWLRTGKCCFLPEEREWLNALLNWGLVDSYRELHPDNSDYFSWFDYRSKGFEDNPRRGLRIDLLLCSPPLQQHAVEAGIDYGIRAMEKPSDHCPVWAVFK